MRGDKFDWSMARRELLDNITPLVFFFYFYSNDIRFIRFQRMGRSGLSVFCSSVCTCVWDNIQWLVSVDLKGGKSNPNRIFISDI